MSNYFEELSKVDCSKHIEKKGRFSYLSWPFAVSELRKRHADATWSVVKSSDGLPYVYTESGCFVEVAVTVNGVTLSQIHPVLDNNNRTIPAPNAFQINTSIQRCLVKAIALHGLGLYIYAGEDLPEDDPSSESKGKAPIIPSRPTTESLGLDPHTEKFLQELSMECMGLVKEGKADDADLRIRSERLDGDQEIALANMMDSTSRSAIVKARREWNKSQQQKGE